MCLSLLWSQSVEVCKRYLSGRIAPIRSAYGAMPMVPIGHCMSIARGWFGSIAQTSTIASQGAFGCVFGRDSQRMKRYLGVR